MKNRIWLGIALLALLGCGGGGGGSEAPAPAPPTLASGELDASYGTGSFVLFTASERLNEMVVAPDGSVYATGDSIIKLDPSGRVALDYGSAGRVAMAAYSPVLDAVGNLYVLSGRSVAKLDPSGRLDTTFGNGGRTDPAILAAHLVIGRLARDDDGSLYVAGNTGQSVNAIVTKLRADGRVFEAFGQAGSSVLPAPFAAVRSLVLDSEMNVTVAGDLPFAGAGAPARPGIVKADRNGTHVHEFGTEGVWKGQGTCLVQRVRALAPVPSTELLIAGSCFTSAGLPSATIQRLDRTGTSLASFRDGGFNLFGPTTPGGFVVESQMASAILRHAGGQIHVAGHRRGGLICQQGAVSKLDASGQAVTDFGFGGGYVALDGINEVRSIGMDAAGRLYLGGFRFSTCGAADPPFVVYRLGG